MTQIKENVLVFGLGAIGGFYSYILKRSGQCTLSVVARSNYDAVKEKGLRLISDQFGEQLIKPDHVLKTASEGSDTKYSYIICTNKALEPEKLPEYLKDVVTPGYTTVVMIQNGVGIEEPLRQKYPSNSIISCVTWVGGKQVEPGVIRNPGNDFMDMGIHWNESIDRILEQTRVDHFGEILSAGGTKFDITDNIQVKRWEKVVWNIAWNGLCALALLNTKEFLYSSPEAIPITRQLMKEVIDIAKSQGLPLEYSLIDTHMEKILGMHGVEPSMLVDLQNVRPMEVEVILGNAMRTAKKLNVPAPMLSLLYVLVKAQDWRIRNHNPSLNRKL